MKDDEVVLEIGEWVNEVKVIDGKVTISFDKCLLRDVIEMMEEIDGE